MEAGEPITQLAAYDYRTAVVADRLGMDILCVSDTGGMILFGHQSTTSVSFDEVMMMSKAIDRGSQYGLRMVDMPYWSFHVSKEQAVENAGQYAYRDRKVKKREFRRLWIQRINAGCRLNGIKYSTFMNGLKKVNLNFNRKVLADIAALEPESFKEIEAKVKAA